MKNLFLLSAIIVFSIGKVTAQRIVPAKNATKYIGKKVTVCDKVYNEDLGKISAVLFLGGDSPKQLLRVFVHFSDLNKAKRYLNASFKGKDICVTGVVLNGKEGPYIDVTNSSQIKPFMIDGPVKQPFKTN